MIVFQPQTLLERHAATSPTLSSVGNVDIAFFGGDPDNFEYPRYDLDVCFFRAYEGGKPASVEHYLKWSPAGASEGELVFVAGHPGRTDRLNTVASLEYLRDVELPLRLDMLEAREAFLLEYGRRGPDAFRHSKEELFTIQNSRKARVGGLQGLRDQALMTRKARDEADLKSKVRSAAAGSKSALVAWDKIAHAKQVAARIANPYFYHERGYAFDGELFTIARTLVRLAQERAKPNSDRLEEFRDSALKSLELKLYSESPIYLEFEEARLAESLSHWKLRMPEDPSIKQVLTGRSPAHIAREVVTGCKLADVSTRRRLADGGLAAIEKSDDPMIKLALAVDPAARAIRKIHEDEVEGVEDASYAQIAKANFELKGDAVYPDATFTLRLAFGVVRGYKLGEQTIPPFTTLEGAFAHAKYHGDKPPYQLPKSWIDARGAGRLTLDTPFNFVSTADIIGGNSGSPVVNRNNEIVGLIFDGNIQSLVLDFGYEDRVARAVSVDSRGLIEALGSIYGAGRLVNELTGR